MNATIPHWPGCDGPNSPGPSTCGLILLRSSTHLQEPPKSPHGEASSCAVPVLRVYLQRLLLPTWPCPLSRRCGIPTVANLWQKQSTHCPVFATLDGLRQLGVDVPPVPPQARVGTYTNGSPPDFFLGSESTSRNGLSCRNFIHCVMIRDWVSKFLVRKLRT